MPQALNTARRILERTGEQPVLSLYFDLDPTEAHLRHGVGAVLRF